MLRGGWLAFLALVLIQTTAWGEGFSFRPATWPAPFRKAGAPDKVIEASGVEAVPGGNLLLVAHDKEPGLVLVDPASGEEVGTPLVSAKFPPISPLGPKWEGMARDADGFFYVIGAHAPKLEADRKAQALGFRFRLDLADPKAPKIDESSVIKFTLDEALAAALKAEGLAPEQVARRKIEGLAVRDRETPGGKVRELIVGLRQPNDKVRLLAAEFPKDPKGDVELKVRSLLSFAVPACEGVASELSSLDHVPELRGFLVTTSSEDEDNVYHGNMLWFVDEEGGPARPIAPFEIGMKAEGLTVIRSSPLPGGAGAGFKLVIVYDNDAKATKVPSRFQGFELIYRR